MEPFTITCPTCESQIRVRNPGLVGQLANCPKCDSILMIELPAVSAQGSSAAPQVPNNSAKDSQGGAGQPKITVTNEHGSPVDSMAMTQDGISADLGEHFREVSDDEYRLAESEVDSQLAAPPVQNPTPSAWLESSPHIPTSDWTSDTTTKKQQYLLIGFFGLAGVAFATLLFFGFLRWYTADQNPSKTLAADAPTESPNAESPSNGDLVTEPVGPLDPEVATAPEVLPESGLANPNSGKLAEGNGSANTTLLPSEPPRAPAEEPANGGTAPSAQQSTISLPKQLQAFGDVLGVEIQPQFPDAIEILSAAPVTAEELGLTNTVGTELPAVDVATQAKIVFPGLVIAERPLSQFLSLWSNLSGIPTVVNLDSLSAAGMDRNQKLALDLVKLESAGAIAQRLFNSSGLIGEVQDNRFMQVSAAVDLIEQKVPAEISLGGLIRDEAETGWLTDSLRNLLPEMQVDWKVVEGKLVRPGQLAPVEWFKAVRLFEGWRLAAGMEPTLSGYSASQLSAKFFVSSDVSGLQTILKEVSAQSRPVSLVLPRICSEAGIHVWFDWPSLAVNGLGPQTLALIVTVDRPLIRALADYANEFSIVCVIEDSRSLRLTSNKSYREQPRLFVIPSEGKTADQWLALLRPFTPASASGVGNVTAISTPDGKFMLVRCCAPVIQFP